MRRRCRHQVGVQARAQAEGRYPPRTQLAKVEPDLEIEVEAEPEEEWIEISFNAASLERLFNMLSLYQKSVAIAAALGSE